ncbi:MAG: DUF1553 domain-containing protein, partial [Planctomycetota bacterium]
NELLWRFPRRRLEAEAIRDAILFVSGQLDFTMGGSLMPLKDRTYVTGTASKQQQYDNARRSVYQPIYRSAVYDMLTAFDFPDPATPTGNRQESTVAPQSLLMMNSQIVHTAASRLAAAALAAHRFDSQRLEWLTLTLFGRRPTDEQRHAILDYLQRRDGASADGEKETRAQWESVCRVLLASNEFIYID